MTLNFQRNSTEKETVATFYVLNKTSSVLSFSSIISSFFLIYRVENVGYILKTVVISAENNFTVSSKILMNIGILIYVHVTKSIWWL